MFFIRLGLGFMFKLFLRFLLFVNWVWLSFGMYFWCVVLKCWSFLRSWVFYMILIWWWWCCVLWVSVKLRSRVRRCKSVWFCWRVWRCLWVLICFKISVLLFLSVLVLFLVCLNLFYIGRILWMCKYFFFM